ncbi:MAG: urease accessory protein UreE [Nitrosopumilus sp.]
MLEVNFPVGNIFHNEKICDLKEENVERLKLSRIELERKILRRKTDRGTDVGLKLDQGKKLHHGDVIENGDTKIIVEQLPEKVLSIKVKPEKKMEVFVLLGHIIGNRHRPISIKNKLILFPIQADSEKEVFTKLLHGIINDIEITIKEEIFSPHTDADVHEH